MLLFLPVGSKTKEGVVQGVASGIRAVLVLYGGEGDGGLLKLRYGVNPEEGRLWDTMWVLLALNLNPISLPAPVAEKTKEQASHLGGAVFSGAGNIAAATGLVKKEEFPTDLKASGSPTTYHTCGAHIPFTPPRLPQPGTQACLPPFLQVCAILGSG